MSQPVIVFDDVVKSFGNVQALQGLSFNVSDRGCLGLLGPNGAGKTTTIKALLGLTHIDSGKVENRARRIGYLPQQPALFGWMTAEEYLRFVGTSTGVPGNKLAQVIKEWLEQVGLTKARKRRVGGFSGGMKQRLGLAAALISDPDVVLLDEPVSALDPVGRYDVLAMVEKMKQDRCVIMSTHILDDAERVCDDVVIMRDGRALLQKEMESLRAEMSTRHEVELAGEVSAIEEVQKELQEQPWIEGCWREGPTLAVALQKGDEDMQRLLGFMAGVSGVAVKGISKANVSLEDIFLQVVNGHDR